MCRNLLKTKQRFGLNPNYQEEWRYEVKTFKDWFKCEIEDKIFFRNKLPKKLKAPRLYNDETLYREAK